MNTEVLVVVPNGLNSIEKYVNSHTIPYPILSDKGSVVTGQYSINKKRAILLTAFKPSVFLVDQTGKIRYTNYSASYTSEPDNQETLDVLVKMRG